MRALKLAGLATALVLPFAATSHAADAIMAPPEPPAAPIVQPEPLQLWTGPYAGVFLGYNWGDFEAIPNDGADDIAGGIYGGYNWQVDNFVFGVEGDVGYSNQEGRDGRFNTPFEGDVGVFGSLRARAGVAFNPFLLYATGGVAVADIEYSDTDGSDSNTQVGYTVGAGVEGFVTDNVTARLEYRYTDYGSENISLPVLGDFSSSYDEHSVRAGIGIKF